jgi:hypothetical protein
MVDYMESTEATGELPLYEPDTYKQALEGGTVPARIFDKQIRKINRMT